MSRPIITLELDRPAFTAVAAGTGGFFVALGSLYYKSGYRTPDLDTPGVLRFTNYYADAERFSREDADMIVAEISGWFS